MDELLMTEVRKKFAGAREACPGMSEEIYALTDYLAVVANDQLVASGIVMMLFCVMDDLKKKKCSFAQEIEFPEYLAEHSLQVQAQMPYLLQVIDAVADEEFASMARAECERAFEWKVPKRVVIDEPIDASGNIAAAVNWWVEAIQHPKLDSGENSLPLLMIALGGNTSRQYTADEIKKFREALTEIVVDEMKQKGRVILRVEYAPDYLLSKAGGAIGLGQYDFPCKTTMWIYADKVSVSAGNSAPEEVIWEATPA